MNKLANNFDIIEKLVQNIKLKYINIDLITQNAKYLSKIYLKIRNQWDKHDDVHPHIPIKKTTKEFDQIKKLTSNSIIGNYQIIQNEIAKIIQIIKLTYKNIIFYYLDTSSYNQDIKQINQLFRMIITFAEYYNVFANSDKLIVIIWLPIDRSRDFAFDQINDTNLLKSTENFNGFTASGVTFGVSPRYTIVTRYEEVAKLLLHELIHNFNVDGNSCHHELYPVISKYKKTKGDNYDYEYSIYESYTELLSSYYNIIFANIALVDYQNMIEEKIKSQILIELLYSYNTVANLLRINNYKTYADFILKEHFAGDICVFEYYYLKALMYNNYPIVVIDLADVDSSNKFTQIYEQIIKLNRKDKLLQEICNNYVKQINFSYIFIKFS